MKGCKTIREFDARRFRGVIDESEVESEAETMDVTFEIAYVPSNKHMILKEKDFEKERQEKKIALVRKARKEKIKNYYDGVALQEREESDRYAEIRYRRNLRSSMRRGANVDPICR